jgi:5'-nucleotidase
MWNRRQFIFNSTLAATGLLAMPTLVAGNGQQKLIILHTNDLHSHVEPFPDNDSKYPGKGGLNRIAAYVKQMRKQHPDLLLFDSGDFSQGTPFYNFYQAEVVLRLMSEIGYTASTVGNHEFDSGLESLKKSLQFANFPLVSSNYDFSDTLLKDSIQKNLIVERNGLRVGVYGLGVELNGLVGKTLYEKTVYLNPVETALAQESYLKEEMKCDFIVCLSHLGFAYETPTISDKVLAGKTVFTDLILGGHTHTFLEKPVEVPNKRNIPVVINQAGWASLMLGQLEFYFEKNGKTIHDMAPNKTVG